MHIYQWTKIERVHPKCLFKSWILSKFKLNDDRWGRCIFRIRIFLRLMRKNTLKGWICIHNINSWLFGFSFDELVISVWFQVEGRINILLPTINWLYSAFRCFWFMPSPLRPQYPLIKFILNLDFWVRSARQFFL